MSIRVKQEICLNVNRIRCIASQAIGRFVLRFHIFEQDRNYQKMAIPVSVIQSPPSTKPQYEINQISYTTKPFIMKISGEVPIAELCIFKNDINIFKYQPDFHQIVLTLVCELIQIDSQKQRIVGTFQGKIRGDTINDCMVIDFHEYGACQVIGSIHSCIYQFAYTSNSPKIPNFESYCQTQTRSYVESLLEYLLEQSKKSQQNIKTYLQTLIALENSSMSSSIVSVSREQNSPQKKFFIPKPVSELDIVGDRYQIQNLQSEVQVMNLDENKNNSYVEQFGNRLTEADQGNDRNSQKFMNLKRKRKRIFLEKRQSERTSKVTIDDFQRIMHENALMIYEKWRKILNLLMQSQGDLMLDAYLLQYNQKYQKLLNQSVIKFKGSYDVDLYANQELQRNKMAFQIRTQTLQNERHANQFKFYNSQFFKGNNPIFFYQQLSQLSNVDKEAILKKSIQWKSAFNRKSLSNNKISQTPQINQKNKTKYMIILVHGLGACRVDMQKIKMQLKRRYHKDIHIMISSSNQSRTEGDIDNMGMRLANQIQHQLAKIDFTPKICLIGHSMGGVIIRSALPRLQKFANLFHSFVSLSSPHVGYNYSSSKLVDVGLWVINYWKKCQSILQLTLADSDNIQECFLYQLSKKKGLEWFKKVTFIGSHQDLYVPYYSARVQKHHQCIIDQRNKVSKALIHISMIDSILNHIKGQLNRIDVNFTIPQQNIDNLIGRAAHINFVSNLDTLKILSQIAPQIIF